MFVAAWVILILVILFFLVGGFLWWGLKKAFLLAMNSVIGFFALYAIQIIRPELVINLWSVLLVAIFGIFGFIAVLILHFTGLAF